MNKHPKVVLVSRIFQIRIDLPRLCENLSREEGRSVTQQEVVTWLRRAGFAASTLGWLVREADLGQLDPAEVVSAEVVAADTITNSELPEGLKRAEVGARGERDEVG